MVARAKPATSETPDEAVRPGLARTAYKPGQSGNPAGRPPGIPGYRDLLTAEDRAKIAAAAGCTPLQFMLSVMLDQNHSILTRVDVAKAAAPYMHRKMPIAIEMPGAKPQVDVAKLLALPRAEREALLATLTKLGVNLAVGAPETEGALPAIVPAAAGKWAAEYEKADAAGRPLPDGLLRAKARFNKTVAKALAEDATVGANLEPLRDAAPHATQPTTGKRRVK